MDYDNLDYIYGALLRLKLKDLGNEVETYVLTGEREIIIYIIIA